MPSCQPPCRKTSPQDVARGRSERDAHADFWRRCRHTVTHHAVETTADRRNATTPNTPTIPAMSFLVTFASRMVYSVSGQVDWKFFVQPAHTERSTGQLRRVSTRVRRKAVMRCTSWYCVTAHNLRRRRRSYRPCMVAP